MGLNAAANRLQEHLPRVDAIRVRQYLGVCPGPVPRSRHGLLAWVQAQVVGGGLVLLDEVAIAIRGRLARFHLPPLRRSAADRARPRA